MDFDPSGLFVISGSTDLRSAIHSAYCKEVDDSKIDLASSFSSEFNKVRLND